MRDNFSLSLTHSVDKVPGENLSHVNRCHIQDNVCLVSTLKCTAKPLSFNTSGDWGRGGGIDDQKITDSKKRFSHLLRLQAAVQPLSH